MFEKVYGTNSESFRHRKDLWKSHFANEETEAHPNLGICPQLHVTDEATPFFWVSHTRQEMPQDRTRYRIITNQTAAFLS